MHAGFILRNSTTSLITDPVAGAGAGGCALECAAAGTGACVVDGAGEGRALKWEQQVIKRRG